VSWLSLKANVGQALLAAYKERGFQFVMSLSEKLISSELLKSKAYVKGSAVVLGEICEVVLKILTIEYIRTRGLTNWSIHQGLILPDVETCSSRFLTELDFVVISPQQVYLYECKGYKGDKVIEGKGELTRDKGKGFNIFEQHRKHAKVFMKAFNPFIKKNVEVDNAYTLPIFSYSQGSLIDKRTDVWKSIMPVVQSEDIFALYDKFLKGPVVWDMEYAMRAVKILEKNKEANTRRHLEYVRSLNAKRNNER
jgi:hypothetical protein